MLIVDLYSGEKTKVTNMNNRDDGLSLSALDLISINAAYVTHLITQSGSVVDFCQILRNRLFSRVAHPVTVTMEKLPKCCSVFEHNTGIFDFRLKFVLEMSFRK